MAEHTFKRGLTKHTSGVGCNKGVYDSVKDFFETPVGKLISEATYRESPAFQICIRDDYLNVYWRGCSVLRFSPSENRNQFLIHHKYLNTGSGDSRYIALNLAADKSDLLFPDENWSFKSGIVSQAINGAIPAVDEHSSEEKTKATQYLVDRKPLLIDLEVGFVRERDQNEQTEGRQYVADRVDMATIVQQASGKPMLRLIEVKLSGDSRLRTSQESVKPEILEQMMNYQKFIENEYDAIVRSYKTIVQNYVDLGLYRCLGGKTPVTTEGMLRDFLNADVADSLDRLPYLLIIWNGKGFSNSNRSRIDHKKRLEQELSDIALPLPEYHGFPDN